ncbi:MAG TPA: EscU/YscU/HrcU family type III secretion system export apparatus switch protein [Euzebyales bacterium]|nr:EscU/YscU/HrcU family type III secretion system export apparatus switch protein [Euzebyales bacterium]
MSQNDGKTEQPTPRRLKQARDEGQIPRSQEVAVAASLLGALMVGLAIGPTSWELWKEQVATLLSLDVSGGQVRSVVTESAARMLVAVVAPFAFAGMFTSVVSNVVQVGARIKPKAARPKLNRISPKAGLERLKPATALWELVRTMLKLGLVTGAVWLPLTSWRDRITRGWTFDSGMAATGDVLATIFVRVIAVAALVAAADYAWNRRKLMRKLRMTKDEVRREMKDDMGDPLMRSRRMERARHLSRNRMLAGVADADVVITNPTHLAVALKYVPTEPAPRVVAKGADEAAAKIRAEARRHGVLVTQDVPLARTLYRRVKLGEFVPHALFEAVAVVLALVYRRRAAAGMLR